MVRKKLSLVVIVSTLLVLITGLVNQVQVEEYSNNSSQDNLKNPTFDFSGTESFWSIVEILEQDKDPSGSQWDSLLSTSGYHALTASEFDPDFFIEYFTLAFKPSRKDKLQELMKDPAKKRYLQHYLEARKRKSELIRQQKKLQSEPILAKVLLSTRKFLPIEFPSDNPPVAFVIFANDGRGYDPIVIDLLASLTWEFDMFLAHESHHWYRNRVLAYNPEKIDPEFELLIATLNQIQAEGIADQIDKADWTELQSNVPAPLQKYIDRYMEALAGTPHLIKTLDSLILLMSAAPESKYQQYQREIADLVPMSGHPTGFYMARLIIEELGVERLVRDVGNPIAFCRQYDEAARLSETDAPTFSRNTLRFLESLESKYISSSSRKFIR